MCVCVCVSVCVMERLLPQFQAWLIGPWCSVYTYTFANVHIKIVLVCCIHLAKLQTLWVIDFMLSGLSLLCCSPFRRLDVVRIEIIK